MLFGRDLVEVSGRRIFEVVAAENVWPEESERSHRFAIDPLYQLRTEQDLEGLRLVGFYHSHPDVPPIPSAFDLDVAWEFFSYLIVHVTSAGASEIRSWVLNTSRGRAFEEQQVIEMGRS